MRKILGILVVFVLIGLQSKADGAEVRNLQGFSSVYIMGNLSVRLVKSDSTYAVIKGDSVYLGKVSTVVKNDELTLRFNKIGSSKTMTVVVFYKSINEITAKAGCTVVANQAIEANKIKIKLGQGSDAELEIKAHKLEVKITQGSDFRIKGNVDQLAVVSTSGSLFLGYNLMAVDANLKAVTGATINVSISGNLSAVAHTSGDVIYKGTPKTISQDVSTGGLIKQKQ